MDAFRTLTGGSNFDRKRFKSDIHHFQPAASSSSGSSAVPAVPAELDFFATPAATESPAKHKKDKKRKRADPRAVSPVAPPMSAVDSAALIKKHRIKLTGLDLPSPCTSLQALTSSMSAPSQDHSDALRILEKNWRELGLEEPTGIQMASWGIMLANRDILACAPTGSGKTFSFILPLLALHPPSATPSSNCAKNLRPKAIVIEPTRELAMQVLRETKRLIGTGGWKVGVLGEEGIGSVKKESKKKAGKRKGKGKKALKAKETNRAEKDDTDAAKSDSDSDDDEEEEDVLQAQGEEPAHESVVAEPGSAEEAYLGPIDILITTPLRLVYALKSNLVSVSSTTHLILDEADKLFELNFLEQTDEILAACSATRSGDEAGPGDREREIRKGMFSATMPSSVEEMAKSVMAGAGQGLVRAIVGHKEAATTTITQELQFVNTEDHKLLSLRSLVTTGQFTPPVLIFVQSIQRAKELTTELLLDGLAADCIHAERTGAERDLAVHEFAAGKVWALVCTDVMGRGIDFKGVKLVVNYDFPQSAMSYIHRIGRTGRAGKDGKAITFFTKADSGHLKTIVNVMRQSGCAVPEWMLALPNPTQDSKKSLKMKPIGRKDISRTNGAGAADDVKKSVRGPKRERIMGGKGGVFKRREGDDDDDDEAEGKKKRKDRGNGKSKGSLSGEVGKTVVGGHDREEREAKKPRKAKVDLAE